MISAWTERRIHGMNTALRRVGLAVLLLASWRVHTVDSQTAASALTGGWMSTWADGPPSSGVYPSVWMDRRGLGFTVGGTLALVSPSSANDAVSQTPAVELGALAARRPIGGSGGDVAGVSARVFPGGAFRGTWIAASYLKSNDPSESALPAAGLGAWARRGRFLFSMQTVQLLSHVTTSRVTVSPAGVDTIAVSNPRRHGAEVQEQDVRLLTGAEASAGWATPKFELQSRLGVVVGNHERPAQWGEIRAAFWPRREIAAFARLRTADGVPSALESVRGSQGAVGIQLVPGRVVPSAHRDEGEVFAIRSLGDGRYTLTVRAHGHRLEVCSDATDWSSTEARLVSRDVWEIVIGMTPGVHRIAMRVDGGPWKPVPGLPTTRDEFGGEVALVVVEGP
jgi:hypothetical protein